MSRTKSSIKNYIWTNLRTVILTLSRFVLRTVFIKTLGSTYVGVEGLLTNILYILALAELGIGNAISFSLYKPLADNDIPKIQALMNFYKKAYQVVALIVLIFGLIVIPFLPHIAKGAENIEHLQLIFCIYLFNTVSSYLIIYKVTIISADQKEYLYSNTLMITNVITAVLQIISLLLWKNYIIYICISSVTGLMSNIFLNYYAGRLYPYIRKRNNEKISKEESSVLFGKIKALLYHKIGQVAISQTDSIITSSIINVTVVGLISNYNMIINVIKSVTSSIFDVMIPSLGNLVATEDMDYQVKVYKKVEFLNYWTNAFSSLSLYFLLTPFIRIWIGDKYVLDNSVVFLLIINFYIYISRLPIFSLRSAAGTFEPDRMSPIIESIINLVVSIILAKKIGVVGVYIGTLVSSFVPYIWCPVIVHKYVFKFSSRGYFFRQLSRFSLVFICGLGMHLIFSVVSIQNIYIVFIFKAVICLLVPNLFIIGIYGRTDEFKYVVNLFKTYLFKIIKK